MAKPRIFVSSTYYDLKHIRKSIELFIYEMGYEAVLFENGDIPFVHHEPLDESCYKELESCHILVLVIGGRYGSQVSEESVTLTTEELEKHYQHYNSITRKEYETAKSRDIPIYIFIEKGVSAEYLTYKENRDNKSIKYAHVDSVNVFRLLDAIHSQKRNNLIKEFESVNDITSWLRDQWAGLFTQFLSKKINDAPIVSLEKQLTNLSIVAETLKEYSENIIQGLSPDSYSEIISTIDVKEKQRTETSKFLRGFLIKHLVEDHNVEVESLFQVFSKSSTLSEFSEKAKNLIINGDSCGILDDLLFMDSDSELSELREELGLTPWDKEQIYIPKKRRRKPNIEQ